MSQGTSSFPWRQRWHSKQPGLDLQNTSGSLGELQIHASTAGTCHGLALHLNPGWADDWGFWGSYSKHSFYPKWQLEGDRVARQMPWEWPGCVVSASDAIGIRVVSIVPHHRMEAIT